MNDKNNTTPAPSTVLTIGEQIYGTAYVEFPVTIHTREQFDIFMDGGPEAQAMVDRAYAEYLAKKAEGQSND